MKFTIDLDCTPEEARQFIGLPNVAPLQDGVMKELEERMRDHIRTLEPESFVKTWMPATVQGWSEMQKMFWGQMGLDPLNAATQQETKKQKKEE